MPGNGHADRTGETARARKTLYTVDAVMTEAAAVSDIAALAATSAAAVTAGGGHVLDTSHVTFGNGAVTLVLILAESHLAIHTWPEEHLVAIDLFSCGAIDAGKITDELTSALGLTDVRTQRLDRGLA